MTADSTGPSPQQEPIPPAARPVSPLRRGVEPIRWSDRGRRAHSFCKVTVRSVVVRALLSVTAHGAERVPAAGPVLLAGNHSSWIDGPLVVMYAPRRTRCMVKAEAFRGPLGAFLLLVGQFPVDRGAADRTALATALADLDDGGVVGVFPEGTRGSGEMQEVQPGIAYLAVHSGAPIVPVAVLGSGDAMPAGRRWPRRSAPVTIVFGDPFTVDPPANPRSRTAMAAVAEDIRVRMAAHLADARAGLTGQP